MEAKMFDAARLSDLIGNVYDCVADPGRWEDFLARLCRAADGAVGTLALISPQERKVRFQAVHGEAAVTAPLVHRYAQHMPFFESLRTMRSGHPYLMSDMTKLIGDGGREILEDTVMFREWNRPHGLTDSFCVALSRHGGEIACLNIVLRADRRPVSDADRSAMTLLMPHVCRAAALAMELERTNSVDFVFRGLADQMANGVLVVDEGLHILYANPSAEALLARATALRSVRGRLVVYPDASAQRIGREVHLAARMELGLSDASFSVPLGDPAAPSVAHVVPLARREAEHRIAREAVAAVVISADQSSTGANLDAAADLYGLTNAEKRVASLTIEGTSRAAIAEMIGVRESTVKSQLESIFAKTGASGQAALIILLRGLSVPVR
jgi:DNA-binding CsgD family transcriptional regulator/PAS domain-containing protein